MNIAIVEDDSLTALFISETVEDLGHTVIGIFDSATPLLQNVLELNVDLVLMDIEINGNIDGIECATTLRTKHNISCIFITSYQNSATINDAMDASPLGYLIKPVSENEIEAALAIASKNFKNSKPKSGDSLEFGEYSYSYINKILTHEGEIIKLSKNEYKILELLCRSYGNVVDNKELARSIWEDAENQEGSLRELIYRLRKKLPKVTINSLSKTGYYITTF